MKINTEAAKQIIDARKAKKLTQTEVAEKLARSLGQTYSMRQYAKLEKGMFPKFKKDVLIKLDAILGINVSEQIYERNVPHGTQRVAEAGKEIGQIREELILLKASVRIFGMTLSELIASKNKVSVAKASLDLEKTISQEVDRLLDELHRK